MSTDSPTRSPWRLLVVTLAIVVAAVALTFEFGRGVAIYSPRGYTYFLSPLCRLDRSTRRALESADRWRVYSLVRPAQQGSQHMYDDLPLGPRQMLGDLEVLGHTDLRKGAERDRLLRSMVASTTGFRTTYFSVVSTIHSFAIEVQGDGGVHVVFVDDRSGGISVTLPDGSQAGVWAGTFDRKYLHDLLEMQGVPVGPIW